ncbi:inactive serine protease scarface-like [Chelonus insularis]|uniref:inactive serine protease scarface-like n=1 Tax=Chelonus insularis TaxID=460826 RepID=UPI001589632A|nr:inactive serine protease scarface-like [Chelonus insularis]
MNGKIILLFTAVLACGNASPYSKISENDFLKTGQSFAVSKSFAHSSGNGDYSQSNSYASGSAAASANAYAGNNANVQTGYAGNNVNEQIGYTGDNRVNASGSGDEYWWMAEHGPFEGHPGHKQSADASIELKGGAAYASKNPFLAGSNVITSQGSFQQSGSSQGTYNAGSAQASGNPFLNTQSLGASSTSFSSANAGASSTRTPTSYTTHISQGSNRPQSTNAFLDQSASQQHVGSGFTVSCSGQGKICVASHLCINGYVSNSVKGLSQIRSDDQQCDIDREVCCTLSARSNVDQGSASNVDRQFTSFSNSQDYQGNSQIITSFNRGTSGGLFGNNNNNNDNQKDLSTGQKPVRVENINGYLPPSTQIPSDSSVVNVVATTTTTTLPPPILPPKLPDPEIIPQPSGPIPTHVQLGCAAALLCVEEQFCGMDGVISETPITLTEEQLLRRVPMTDCKNPDTGIVGKCCRDPNYVDPWPTGNLPANYSGGFDEQGFPTYLNIQKTRPTKKPATNTPTKGGRYPTKAPQRPNYPTQITVGPTQNYNQYSTAATFQPTGTVYNGGYQYSTASPVRPTTGVYNGGYQYSTASPIRPTTTFAPSIPINKSPAPSDNQYQYFPNTPKTPVRPRPPVNNFDQSPTNANPIAIPSRAPGSQCGVKNSVQRPSGLNDVEVAFGEIPWEAMILSNQEKKLLCSGAIVAPNVVLTAARCVDGYQAQDVSIKAGEWKLGYELKHEEPLPFEIVQVSQIVQHPGYLPGSQAYDLAILFLEHAVHFDQHVGTICLRHDTQPVLPGSRCISTGWGKHILQSHLAGAIMHSIDIDILDKGECQERLLNAETPLQVDESLVCTKASQQRNNMCQVDLGGPLACDRGDGVYELIGVYNQDTGCLPTNQVATFALIDVAWVEFTMNNPPKIREQSYTPTQQTQQPIQPYYYGQNQPCNCQQSNLPPQNNQYLPPV